MVKIKEHNNLEISEFLLYHGFEITKENDHIFIVQREDELPVFMSTSSNNLYFEVDLGSIKGVASEQLFFDLLDLNTEILPVSFGINNTNPNDSRLVLVESRKTIDLHQEELLSVFDALELATDRAETILAKRMFSFHN